MKGKGWVESREPAYIREEKKDKKIGFSKQHQYLCKYNRRSTVQSTTQSTREHCLTDSQNQLTAQLTGRKGKPYDMLTRSTAQSTEAIKRVQVTQSVDRPVDLGCSSNKKKLVLKQPDFHKYLLKVNF